jgi:protein tyrosine phosphatase (PTP) superfamily phosphohydrolase (DUF442 family)
MARAPEPTSRSAQAGPAPVADEAQDPLDHLPPLDLPGEVTRSSAATPAASLPAPPARPADNSAKKPEAPRESAAASSNNLDATSAPAPEPAQSASVGPGLARFVAVDLKLAGGSLPSGAGLNWLVEKGYRTVLDLRESSEVPPTFIAEATRLGLRYVALPIGVSSIDREHLDRFNFEIAAGEARPLYFFDSDGTRAGALWYIRRITSDRVDHQIARREAEELGLSDQSYWSAVTRFVAGSAAPEKSAQAAPVQPAPAPAAASPDRSAHAAASPSAPAAAGHSTQDRSDSLSTAPLPSLAAAAPSRPSRSPSQRGFAADAAASGAATPSDPLGWRPFVAMAITGLSLPLAYWSGSAVPAVLRSARASLPGPARRPKSLPGALDA